MGGVNVMMEDTLLSRIYCFRFVVSTRSHLAILISFYLSHVLNLI